MLDRRREYDRCLGRLTVEYFKQSNHAVAMAVKFERFALHIGCQVQGDTIVATVAQAEQLDAEWARLTKDALEP